MIRMTTASLLLLPGLWLALPSPTAQAQCDGSSFFCAEAHFGASVGVGVGVRVHPAPPPPPRQQVIVIETAPPPPPPPRVVLVEPAPPPPPHVVYIHQPAPPPQLEVVTMQHTPREPRGWGLQGHLGGMVSSELAMGGARGGVRFRPNMGRFALDLSVGVYGGRDYNDMNRVEVPVTADALFYINPRSRLQVYGVVGVGASFSHAESQRTPPLVGFGIKVERDYVHLGGEAGVGLELRLSRWFALQGDVRGFVRQRVDSNPEPEFVDRETGRETDTSGGVLVNIGAAIYF